MLTRTRRRAALGIAAATAALLSGAGAAPATGAESFVHSFRLTLSPANTKALSDSGVAIIPLPPATSQVRGTGDSRRVTLTFPVVGQGTAPPFDIGGGVWFLNTRTWRGSAVTDQQFVRDDQVWGGGMVGAVSSLDGARVEWLQGSAVISPGSAFMPDSFIQVLNDVAGADVIVHDPFVGGIEQCMDGPCGSGSR